MKQYSQSTDIESVNKKSWSDAIKAYLDPRALIMLFLGFSAGIPIVLIFSTLSLWLTEAGIDKSVVTMFSWAALGYSFKFIWAPLVDALPIPFLTKALGRRRAWMLIAQFGIIASIMLMASIDPINQTLLTTMAVGAVLLGFSSATQDIAIDAYRIELAPVSMQTTLSAMYTMGYRFGMIVAGAGALYLADFLGSTDVNYSYDAWRTTYLVMAGVMGIGVITTLLIREPISIQPKIGKSASNYIRLVLVFSLSVMVMILTYRQFGAIKPEFSDPFLKFAINSCQVILSLGVAILSGWFLVMVGFVNKQVAYVTWIEPIIDFFRRYGKKALLLLALIGLYRISDIVAGVIAYVFYENMGFSKTDIATAVKVVGLGMTIAGGFLGGVLANKIRIMPAMMIGAILASATNLLFILLTFHPGDKAYMYMAVIFDNLAAGLAMAVLMAFMSALTSIKFTAVQYAIFSSLMTLFPKVLGGYSGGIVNEVGYPIFFTFTFAIGIPILLLIYLVDKKLDIGENAEHQNKTTGEPANDG